jgi:hypothetical protein
MVTVKVESGMAINEKSLGLHPRYVVDESGEATEVILDIAEYRNLIEQIEYQADVEALQAAIDSETEFRPWREVRDEIESRHSAK